jgi:hypothetical protein
MNRVLSSFLMISYFLVISISCNQVSISSSSYNDNNHPELVQKTSTIKTKTTFLKSKQTDDNTAAELNDDTLNDNSTISKLEENLEQGTNSTEAKEMITKIKDFAYSTINSLEDKNFDQYQSASNIVCQKNTCFPPFGTCLDDSTCQCLDGFANFFPENNQNPNFYCSYEKRSQLTAFLLEFLLSNGIGHFYAGRVLFGIFKMVVLIGPIVLGILMFCCNIGKGSDGSTCCNLIIMIGMCLLGCTALAWQLADLIMFGMNKYADGNGISLKHW